MSRVVQIDCPPSVCELGSREDILSKINDDPAGFMRQFLPGATGPFEKHVELFETLFGSSIDYGTRTEQPDEKKTLEILDSVTTDRDGKKLIERIQAGCRGGLMFSPSLFGQVTSEHAEANKNFAAGNYEIALQQYKELIRQSPHDSKLYSNAGLCLIRLGQFEEAIATVSYPMYLLNDAWFKVHLVCALAYCHLGFIAIGVKIISEIKNISNEDRSAGLKQMNEIAKSMPINKHRHLDEADLNLTIQRLFSLPNNLAAEDTAAFLLVHLHYHWMTSDPALRGDSFRDVLKTCINHVPVLNKLLTGKIDFLALSSSQYRLLMLLIGNCFTAISCCTACAQHLVEEQAFVQFLVEIGKTIATGAGMKAAARRQAFGQNLAEAYSMILCMLALHPSIKSTFFRQTYPLNDLNWHARFNAAMFCIKYGCNIPKAFCYLVASEPWFLEKLNDDSQLSCSLALMSTISRFDLLPGSQLGLTLFWLKIMANSRIADLCSDRPGVWTLFVRHLDYYGKLIPEKPGSRSDPTSAMLDELGLALKILELLFLAYQKKATKLTSDEIDPLVVSEENVTSLCRWLVFIARGFVAPFLLSKNFREQTAVNMIGLALTQLAQFSLGSRRFRKAFFGSSDFSVSDILKIICSERLSGAHSSAFYCLAALIHSHKALK